MKLLNNIKEPITSIIGLIIIVVTLIAIHKATITFLYEGLAGIATGTIFFLMPDKIGSMIVSILVSLKKKLIQ